jgi:hypothetical protein
MKGRIQGHVTLTGAATAYAEAGAWRWTYWHRLTGEWFPVEIGVAGLPLT